MKRLSIMFLILIIGLAATAVAEEEIITAAKNGDLETVQTILAEDPSKVNAVDDVYNQTPLHWAAVHAHWDVVDLILEHKPDVNALSVLSASPLMVMSHNNNPEMAKKLIELGADPRTQNRWGMTAMHLAAWRGCTDVVKVLLDAGADPEVKTKDGWTVLHQAYIAGHDNVVVHLLRSGADTDVIDNKGNRPADLYNPRPEPSPQQPTVEELQQYVGHYVVREPYGFEVFVKDNKLILAELSYNELYLIGQDMFYSKECPWKVQFFRDSAGNVTKMDVHFIRQTATAHKVE